MAPSDRRRTATATTADAGLRLDKMLATALTGLSRARLQALIAEGRVSLAGRTILEASYRVKPGQTFAVFIPQPAPAEPAGQAMDLAIVHEDDDVIVIDKPAGLVVHPAPGNPDRTLVNALIAHCGPALTGIGGVRRPGIVHRLDKETSGLLVAAKTAEAHAALAEQFAAHSVGRAYRAVVWGVPAPADGEIVGNIGRDPHHRKRMAIVHRGGKEALTYYTVVRTLGPAQMSGRAQRGPLASIVDCHLATGRTHQIRVHMAARGHPLIGDRVYGGKRQLPGPQTPAKVAVSEFGHQALHARRLAFDHPRDRRRLAFESPLPKDISELIDTFELF